MVREKVVTSLDEVLMPRVGGVVKQGGQEVAWTGGSNIYNQRTEPASPQAYRPHDCGMSIAHDIHLRAGFASSSSSSGSIDNENMKLGTLSEMKNPRYSGPTLRTWVKNLRRQFELDGRDTVFRLYEKMENTETYLLTEWGKVEEEDMIDWEKYLETNGDSYDLYNVATSGSFIYKSVSRDLAMQFDNMDKLSGPRMFYMIIKHFEDMPFMALRKLMKELSHLKLSKEPGEDVNTFSNKVIAVCQHIQSATNPSTLPDNLNEMVARLYLDTTVGSFQKFAADMVHHAENKAFNHDTWPKIVDQAKAKYQSFLKADSWGPSRWLEEKKSFHFY